MSQIKDDISINLSEDEILQNLRQFITGDHADLVSEAILALIDTSSDRQMLFKATLGLKFTHKYKVGDLISIKESGLYTWSWNKEEMTNRGLLTNNRVDAVITGLIDWEDDHYKIKYFYIEEKTTEIKKNTHCVSESYVDRQERWPE